MSLQKSVSPTVLARMYEEEFKNDMLALKVCEYVLFAGWKKCELLLAVYYIVLTLHTLITAHIFDMLAKICMFIYIFQGSSSCCVLKGH
jgi:hypothetical protein